jgi:hypothetical protein
LKQCFVVISIVIDVNSVITHNLEEEFKKKYNAKWVEEKKILPDQKRFIVDEKTELVNGEIVRFYKLSEGLEIKVEEASGNSISGCWNIFREKRNKMLQLTDWTQLSDCELTIEDRKEFRGYRNYLRTLPVLYNDSTIIHAKVYSFEEWKKGKR